MVAFGIYGFIERCLVPFGLHHIWNVPFQMQIGEYTNAAGQVFHGDIPRYMAGDPDGGQTVWRLPVQNVWSAGSGYRYLALC
ncbi:PTS system protein [Klebsiella pneumoniae]|uniref:PTS system protein n=1 Tax=Klebsiella pneumoniae TaxID=573 RepID=A0A2X1QBT9_KLEPN|nr:PTS system protein [Klebsiella pneumoniae]